VRRRRPARRSGPRHRLSGARADDAGALRFHPTADLTTLDAAGVPVSIDLNLRVESSGLGEDVRRTLHRAIELADVVFGSAHEEFGPLAGTEDLETAARAIGAGRRAVVMRRGADGARAFDPDGVVDAPAFPVTAVNSVGAGDAFNGGFIAARLEGCSMREALRWGNAVAALKIQGTDARALPSRADVDRLLGPRDPSDG